MEVNKTLTKLDFSRNNISDDGMIALSEMLKVNKTLTHYDKLKYFNHLNSNWQEPLDSLYNFYICFKHIINI